MLESSACSKPQAKRITGIEESICDRDRFQAALSCESE
jgi:hypothetical protein